MSKRDYDFNPPAFPTENERQTGAHVFRFEGLTLRDYFAAQVAGGDWAAQSDRNGMGLFDATKESAWKLDAAAELYYRMADAMLAARKGGASHD